MKLHFPKLYHYDRLAEPCFAAIPFAQGCFREGMSIRVLDQGIEMPVQAKITSRYADGSVRYLFVRFTADLPADRAKELDVEMGADAGTDSRRLTSETEDGILVDGGLSGLRFTVKNRSCHLVESLTDTRTTYGAERFVGPLLKDGQGNNYLPFYERWRVTEDGPLVAVLHASGCLLPADGAKKEELPSFETKITVYAGKPWMEVSFRLMNTTSEALHAASFVFSVMAEDGKFDDSLSRRALREGGDAFGEGSAAAGCVLHQGRILETTGWKYLKEVEQSFSNSSVRCCVGSSNYKTNFTVSDGESVERVIDTAYLMAEANEHIPEVFYGTFFTDRTDRKGGICATVFQAQQNYPKAVKSDNSGLYVMLVPENVEKVVFESGMSREQRFLLHFHDAETSLTDLDNRSLIYQMPDRPWLDADVYRKAGVGPDIFVAEERQNQDVEIALMSRCDSHSRSYGMLNFGDAPDMNYTRQGRGKGMLVWTNNEYDFPHACALLYMRTGERRFLDYVIAAASHWMDVDVCHYSKDPLHMGGQWEHCRQHVLDSCMVCSHEWVEGLLDLYHFTGDERALETALGIGENVLRLLETPMYQVRGESNARETGWALRSLTALYVETSDPKWLEKTEWIVEQFRAWTREFGGWVATYTDNTVIHVPFMIAVAMGSLYRYYEVFPSEEIKSLLLAAADDLIDSALMPSGLFYYKELPSLNRLGSNTMILESLTIAYRLSGDDKYLKLGLPTFWRDLSSEKGSWGVKSVMEDTVILNSDPPKHFAQSFVPVFLYYKAAVDAGLIAHS